MNVLLGAFLLWAAGNAWEIRHRIWFSVPEFYFGPARTYNTFMGGNWPSDHSVSLQCRLRIFSEKSQVIGLHDFRLDFCRRSRFRSVVFFSPDMGDVYRGLMEDEAPQTLDALELPPRQFVSLDLTTFIGPKHWEELRPCTLALQDRGRAYHTV